MGREVRMVPENWQHPKEENGNHRPLFNGPYSMMVSEWDEGEVQWNKGLCDDYNGGWKAKGVNKDYPYEEWSGERPKAEDYMPEFEPGTATHCMMYETCSEGTPIGPAFATPEELAQWLAENSASSFGSMTATYEQWLGICQGGFAPSMVIVGNRMISGVEAMAKTDN